MFGSTFRCDMSVSRTFVRSASKKVKHRIPSKIPVQLLKDHPVYGTKGEIINVSPSFMRNYLHHGDKACYITETQGPRIPVVEKIKTATPKTIKSQVKAAILNKEAPTNDRADSMSLSDLSALFNNMRSSRSLKNNTESSISINTDAVPESTYSSSDLKESIPKVHTFTLEKDAPVPITREYLTTAIYEMAGLKIPVSDIKLTQKSGDKDVVSVIDQEGSYNLIINVPVEKTKFTSTLVVKK